MLKILSHITGAHRAEIKDAKRIYKKIMVQSRKPEFYGEDLCADTTDGRMEILCLHLSMVMYALRSHNDTGAKLSQALYDVMVDDFDVALREEGLSDTGVARRIKPLARIFFTRVKQYTGALGGGKASEKALAVLIEGHVCKTEENADVFVKYTASLLAGLNSLSLGQIALAKIEFPTFH